MTGRGVATGRGYKTYSGVVMCVFHIHNTHKSVKKGSMGMSGGVHGLCKRSAHERQVHV